MWTISEIWIWLPCLFIVRFLEFIMQLEEAKIASIVTRGICNLGTTSMCIMPMRININLISNQSSITIAISKTPHMFIHHMCSNANFKFLIIESFLNILTGCVHSISSLAFRSTTLLYWVIRRHYS